MSRYLALDLGTTTIKAALFGDDSRMLALERAETTLITGSDGMVECDPRFWFELPCSLIRRITDRFGADDITALAVSSQGLSILPVDEDFMPLRQGISWLDTRADAECREIFALCPDISERTGKPYNPQYTLPKLIWLKKYELALFERAHMFLMPLDYLCARLTGAAVTDHSMAGGSMLYEPEKCVFSTDLAERFGIPIEKLPKIEACGYSIGRLTEEGAALTGLSANTTVALGGQDQKIAALGAGLDNRAPTLSLGTSCAIEFVGSVKGFPRFIHTDGKTPLSEGCINTACGAIKWLSSIIGLDYDTIDAMAEAADSGNLIFRPHLAGVGTPYGQTVKPAAFENLTLDTDRGQLCRALLEGIACEIRRNIEAAVADGCVIEGLRAFGGGCRSGILCRIIADITQLPLTVLPITEMALFGAASAASLADRGCPLPIADSEIKQYQPSDASKNNLIYQRYID